MVSRKSKAYKKCMARGKNRKVSLRKRQKTCVRSPGKSYKK